MSEQEETKPEELEQEETELELLEGAAGDIIDRTVVIGVQSPTKESDPPFPIDDMFPDTIEGMKFYQETLMKFLHSLRDLANTQRELLRIHAVNEGLTWDEFVQRRKEHLSAALNWNDDSVGYMRHWKDEDFLPECHSVITQIQFIHLCRWTLHKRIETYYKEHEDEPRLESHSKQQTSEDLSVYDGDSSSHKSFVRQKNEKLEFDEKGAVLVFNRYGVSYLTENQIRGLERAICRILETKENKNTRSWTEEAILVTRETGYQTPADVPSISFDNSTSNTEDPTIPPTPNPSFASSPADPLSGDIPALPEDSSPDDSPIDPSEGTTGHTADCTEDEATSPEDDQAHRRKHYSHKLTPKSDVTDTE